MTHDAERVLTVRVGGANGGSSRYQWHLYDDTLHWTDCLIASSRPYRSILEAEQAARDAFGGGLGSVVGIDLETHTGRTERIR